MQLRRQKHNPHQDDHLVGIAPIYKVSMTGEAKLIGTGFWVTQKGHFITARHVIADNIGEDGQDQGPIYAMCMSPKRVFTPRVLSQSDLHSKVDLALCSTSHPEDVKGISTWPLPLTLVEPAVGDEVHTHSFISPTQSFYGGEYNGMTTSKLNVTMAIPSLNVVFDLDVNTRKESGRVTEIYEEERDSVMLPFPCFQTAMPIYSANSGGPVFDSAGRICGINCSSYEGTDISFHIPIRVALELVAFKVAFVPEDAALRTRSLLELGLAQRTPFEPPLIEQLFTFRQRLILRPLHAFLNLADWIKWCFKRRGN